MPRKLFRFLEWTLQADREPDATDVTFQYLCLAEDEDGKPCDAVGPVLTDLPKAQLWPFEHIKVQQEHRSYAHRVTMPAVMVPKEEPN